MNCRLHMTLLVLLLLDLRTVAHSDLGDGMVIDHRSLDEQANGNKPRAGVPEAVSCPPEKQVQHATED